MSKEINFGTYEKDIVDRLWRCEKAGKGKLLELCTVESGDRLLPFVAFVTGGDVVVTARHHVNEFWGTTEAVMKLAESGQEGLTLVPVIDVAYFAESEARKERFTSAGDKMGPIFMYDMYKGYKGYPFNAKNDWGDYRYGVDQSPAQIAEVKKLIDGSLLFIDLHNSYLSGFCFVTSKTDQETERILLRKLVSEIEKRKQAIRSVVSSYPSLRDDSGVIAGVFEFNSGNKVAITYAADSKKMNIGFEIPILGGKDVVGFGSLSDPVEMAIVTAETIASLGKALEELKGDL